MVRWVSRGPGQPGRVYPKSCNLGPRRQPPLPAGPDASRATVTVKEARTTGRSESEAPRLSDVTITDGLSLSLSLRVPLSLSLSQAPGSDSDSRHSDNHVSLPSRPAKSKKKYIAPKGIRTLNLLIAKYLWALAGFKPTRNRFQVVRARSRPYYAVAARGPAGRAQWHFKLN